MRIKCYPKTMLLTLADGYTIWFDPKLVKYIELEQNPELRINELVLTFEDGKVVKGHPINQMHFYKLLAAVQKFKPEVEDEKEFIDNE